MDSARIYAKMKSGVVRQRGLTILELTIVIAIIGILSAGVITAINIPVQLQRARDGQRKSDLRTIQSNIEIYRTDIRSYPANLPGCGQSLAGGNPPSTYMSRTPCDPTTHAGYSYSTANNGYTMYACLERASDPQADPNLVPPQPNTCAGGLVSYTVRSQ